jgi:hypothetical protein
MMKSKANAVSNLEKLHLVAKATEAAWSAAAQQADALRPAYDAAFNAFEKAETAARRRVKRLGKLADPAERVYIRKVLDVAWTQEQESRYKAYVADAKMNTPLCEYHHMGYGNRAGGV